MKRRWFAVALAAAVVPLSAYLLAPGEERRVRGRLEAVAATLSTPAREPDLARLGRIARLRESFTPDAVIYFEREAMQPIRDRDQISGLAANALSQLGPMKVELRDIRISFRDGSSSVADVRLEVRLVSRDPHTEPETLDARALGLTLRKIDGEWLVASARVAERDDSVR